MLMPDSHEPSLRVPLPRLNAIALPDPPAQAGGLLLPIALLHAAIQPLRFMLGQLWLGAAPLADLLGVQEVVGANAVSGQDPIEATPTCEAAPTHTQPDVAASSPLRHSK